ncbi:hypothetical protein DFP92_1343 [Yoonia sediminilitoris]|uniref:Uncharacterized protein n=1 Tax=Yoonia sediminilitoris TaxID=1286148 RepID=A0A2T6K1A1_9RHOB|nr:hypothetical protein C8N45_1344 [Yoonia sediminilitoris]RCW89440.1 hypothetical protein DFP92_1343 [Yoonia sediminilitoris]
MPQRFLRRCGDWYGDYRHDRGSDDPVGQQEKTGNAGAEIRPDLIMQTGTPTPVVTAFPQDLMTGTGC